MKNPVFDSKIICHTSTASWMLAEEWGSGSEREESQLLWAMAREASCLYWSSKQIPTDNLESHIADNIVAK